MYPTGRSEQVYKLVKGMQARGVPIDGVGLQFHWSLDNHDSLADVAKPAPGGEG